MAKKRETHGLVADLTRPTKLIVLFLAPALILFLVFLVYPMFRVIKLSFFHGSATSQKFEFVGLTNFSKLIRDGNFRNALSHNILFILIYGTLTIIVSLLLAQCLTLCRRGRTFFRVVFLFPNVMAVVAVAVLWSFIFNPSFGILNALLRLFRLDFLCRAWLGEPGTALFCIMVIQIWAAVGFYMVLFYAGLLNIPAELIEAARIDGANGFQTFFHVNLPLLSEILQIAVIYIIIHSLNIFSLVFIINEGQANRYNDVMLTYLYEQGFINGNFGYACAIGVAMLVIIVTITMLVSRFFRKRTVEI
jgi:N-acetylglucosamine transport system permease protein